MSSISVNDLARAKALPEDFLRQLGLRDRKDGVVIPYRLEDGSDAPRQRLRTALSAKEGSLWLLGKGKPVPYGLDRLKDAREKGFLVLMEGESDSWTLWHHGFPALGIPGAGMAKILQPEHLQSIDRVLVLEEPDKGGASFVAGVAQRLARINWPGEAFSFSLSDFKDANDLHKNDAGAFVYRFQAALDAARPLELQASQPDPSTSADALIAAAGVDQLKTNPGAEDIEAVLREVAEQLDGTDSIRKMVVRNVLIDRLGLLAVRSPARLVDAALGYVGADAHDDHEPRLFLSDPTPCSEAVDGPELLTRLADTFQRYLALVDGAAVALALWALHTYTISASFVSPILAIVSPVKRCGKTTLLTILAALVPRRLPASSITPAALFRTVEGCRPTLLIDEADSFLRNSDELRGILNSGHTKSTAVVVRTVGEDHEPKTFSTWCPKAIALIGRLPSTLEDRSVLVPMRRRSPGESVDRLRADRIDSELEELRSQAARWADDHLDELREAEPEVPEEFHDRARDNWRPLLAIAEVIGGEWPQSARGAARRLERSGREDETTPTVQLLADIRQLFTERSVDRLTSDDLVKDLRTMEDRPWPEWGRQAKPISATQVARMLKPFGVRPRTIRTGPETTAKGYRLADFDDVFSRYLPPKPSHRNNVDTSTKLADSEPSQNPSCYGSKNDEKAQNDNVVTAVTGQKGESDGSEEDDADREVFDL